MEKQNKNVILIVQGFILSGLCYFALLLFSMGKLKDRRSVEFLAFIWPIVQLLYLAVIFSTHLVTVKCIQ